MKTHFLASFSFCLILVGCVSGSSRADQERAALHMQIGTGYLSQGLYPQAISELLKAEKLNPKDPAILNNLGLAYHLRGKLKQAEEKFRAAVTADPRFTDGKNNLARNLIDQNRLDEAITILEKNEGDLTYAYAEKTYSNLGMAYFEKGSYVQAEKHLLRALEIRREGCTASYYYGRTLQQLNQPEKAAAEFDRAIENCRSARFEEPIFYSAMSYYSLGEKEKSKARLEELLKDYPQSKYVAKAKGMLQLLEQ
jgi:type IV pilus assembly protein PilF